MSIIVFPEEDKLKELSDNTHEWMYPNTQPYAVMAPEYLSRSQCHEIVKMYDDVEPYKQEHCGATTRQMNPPMRGALRVVEDFALGMNKLYWQYDIAPNGVAWMQTYEEGAVYPLHTDTYPGQSRKLTAVVMLTDHELYRGGVLTLETYPSTLSPPVAQGSIVVFQSWHMHEVGEITRGYRQTINMGFWGPPFK